MAQFRKASRKDAWAIRRLVWQVGINPTGLDWRRFLVAVDERDQVIACGQIKPHGETIRELASIAVRPAYRGQGIARQVIEQLIARTPPPLYLYCREALTPFYEKFGFRVLGEDEMPAEFRRLWRVIGYLRRLFPGFKGPRMMVKRV